MIESHKAVRQNRDTAALRPLQQASPHGHPGQNVLSPISPLNPDEDESFFTSILNDYEAYVYPFFPIITRGEAETAVAALATDADREARAFVYALVAVTHSLAPEVS